MTIRKISITIEEFIRIWLPTEKRQASRVGFLRGLLAPFQVAMLQYLEWRDETIIKAKVTGETMSLTWYLNYLFDPTDKGIYIETATVSGLAAGDEVAEPSVFFVAGDEVAEPAQYAIIGAQGEDTNFGIYSFAVFVPAAIANTNTEIRAIVNCYRFAGKSFKIIRY